MNTTIFVPMLISDAKWIFCNTEEAFDQGLLNGEGKILTGYHCVADAISAAKEKQPQEPFAVMHVMLDESVRKCLSMAGALVSTNSDKAWRRLWTLTREGS